MVKGLLLSAGVFCAVGSVWLWSSSSDDDYERLIITGSSTVAPLVSEIAKQYEALHPGVRIDVQTGGSSRGIADAQRGLADIGMSSRALKSSESGLVTHLLALDGICVILHSDNPVNTLSDQQVVDIYLDHINNWSEFGGDDAPITVVNKAEGRATLEVFLDYHDLTNNDIKPDVIIGDNEQGVKTVVGNVHAIAYVSIGTAEYDAQTGAPIKLLPTSGIPASVKTLANGRYPVARPLNLVTSGEATGRVADFIEYCQSSAVDDLIKAQYFVPPAR